ncbi:MAG: hypothetical protein HN940_03255 [Planctomycetes bacterium]|nr:hypothetical protein [Planctomycetota bacterium]
MTTSGVDGIGGVGGVEGPQRPAETPDTDGAGAIDGPGQVDGSGGPESLEDDFKPVPESVRDHARWMGQLSEMGPQTVQAGSDVERIADQGLIQKTRRGFSNSSIVCWKRAFKA